VAVVASKQTGTPLDADVAVAEGLLAGDPSAPLEAWRRFSPAVAVTLRRMLGPGGDLEDMVQEVFLRFFDGLGGLRNRQSIRAFITGIAVRRAQEEIRRRDVRRRLAHLLPSFLRPRTFELDTQSRDAIARLYRVLDSLRPEDRTLYVLRYIQGLDHNRLAEVLGVSSAAALFGAGSFSGVGRPALPASLYQAQRAERLGR
jgi:RNA polymerase sigma-70 factor (ECF subfamily)